MYLLGLKKADWNTEVRLKFRCFDYPFFSLIQLLFLHGLPKGGRISESLLYLKCTLQHLFGKYSVVYEIGDY